MPIYREKKYRVNIKALAAALVFIVAGNGFVFAPLAAALSANGLADTGLPAGNYLWQSQETGNLGGAERAVYFAGYKFLASENGYASQLCGYFDGPYSVDLYDSGFNLLASAAVTSNSQWNCLCWKL